MGPKLSIVRFVLFNFATVYYFNTPRIKKSGRLKLDKRFNRPLQNNRKTYRGAKMSDNQMIIAGPNSGKIQLFGHCLVSVPPPSVSAFADPGAFTTSNSSLCKGYANRDNKKPFKSFSDPFGEVSISVAKSNAIWIPISDIRRTQFVCTAKARPESPKISFGRQISKGGLILQRRLDASCRPAFPG